MKIFKLIVLGMVFAELIQVGAIIQSVLLFIVIIVELATNTLEVKV